jgi:hypothetical protein
LRHTCRAVLLSLSRQFTQYIVVGVFFFLISSYLVLSLSLFKEHQLVDKQRKTKETAATAAIEDPNQTKKSDSNKNWVRG